MGARKGHKGKFGHEFLEFELQPSGKLRYANNSHYKNDVMIRKEINVSDTVIDEFRKIVQDSDLTKEDDDIWPAPDRVGRQEFELVIGNIHISLCTTKIGSFSEVDVSRDPDGLRTFYYLIQD